MTDDINNFGANVIAPLIWSLGPDMSNFLGDRSFNPKKIIPVYGCGIITT